MAKKLIVKFPNDSEYEQLKIDAHQHNCNLSEYPLPRSKGKGQDVHTHATKWWGEGMKGENMKEFTIDYENANKLYKFAKAFIDAKNYREKFTLIQCEITKNELKATMISGISAGVIRLPILCDEEMILFIAPPTKPFKKNDFSVIVSDNEKETTYTTVNGSMSIRKPPIADKELFDVENKCFSEAKETAWIDPKLLYQSLSGFNDDIIKLDFLGENKGVMISSKEAKSIVLPKRKPNDTTTYWQIKNNML